MLYASCARMTALRDNEDLTRIGPGTLMGNLMRQYWIPACLSSEIEADGPPLRLALLGERLIAFRDSAGRIGVMDHRCPHRCASLFFGRNEQGGLRCVYHGWKFDVDGNCIDMPNVPPEQDFKDRVKARRYPARERGGLVYVYMGARKELPPLPQIAATLCRPQDTAFSCRLRACNWLQAMEGDLDTSHFGFLHAGSVDPDDIDPALPDRFQVIDRAPSFHAIESPWGVASGAYRPADVGRLYYRFAHFVMPFWTLYPNGPLRDNVVTNVWVPMDDDHTMVFNITWTKRTPPLALTRNGKAIPGLGRTPQTLPNTTDWFGRWRLTTNAGNDYLIDREVQRTQSYTGITGVTQQDSAVTESMGAIVDRSLEHLAPSDRVIAMTRRRLLNAARALAETHAVPPLVDNPEAVLEARSGDVLAPAGQPWQAVYDEALRSALNPAEELNAAD
jgi:phthalate 4,5-dioxygenase oxygenase subunit